MKNTTLEQKNEQEKKGNKRKEKQLKERKEFIPISPFFQHVSLHNIKYAVEPFPKCKRSTIQMFLKEKNSNSKQITWRVEN